MCRDDVIFKVNFIVPSSIVVNFTVLFVIRFRARNFKVLSDGAKIHVQRYFTDVCVQNDILHIDIDDFFNIINDDMLNVKDETLVWKCCLRWIDFDKNNRKKFITKLMTGIRLGLLEPKVNVIVFKSLLFGFNFIFFHLI